jgi:hypothetical protein
MRILTYAIAVIVATATVDGQQVLSFSTPNPNVNGWTVTAGGAVNAVPFVFIEDLPSFGWNGNVIGMTSDGLGSGAFLPGGSLANFDGFWTAAWTFSLPNGAQNITLNYTGLFADDRVLLELNGTPIGAAGLHGPGEGSMVFSDGVSSVPYSFSGPAGSGAIPAGFNVGGQNTLTAIINNTGVGINGSLTSIASSSGDRTGFAVNGTISYSLANNPPAAPILVSPADGALDVSIPPILNIAVSDPDTNRLTGTFYGCVQPANVGADFTIVALPDTQFYSETNPGIFQAQTDWIISNRTKANIVYVASVGDIVNDGDTPGDESEWDNATNALYRLESPALTGMTDGIPYGVVPGNHDHIDGTNLYNTFFGVSHFIGRAYYGGHYGSDNDNHYDLFSAGGLDFVVTCIDFNDSSPFSDYTDIDAWSASVIQANSNRRAIVVSHDILAANGSFDARGQAIYDNLKGNTNLFLMVCGHNHGAATNCQTYQGNTIISCLADYQDWTNGGDGYLRLYKFSPRNNVIHVKTYSPYRDLYCTDATNQFDIPYDMSGMWVPFATNSNIASGSTTSAAWPGLTPGTQYQWYVTVSDGQATTTGPVWTLTVTTNVPPVFQTVKRTEGMISFEWGAIPGRTYQLQYKTNLAQVYWISLGGSNAATTATMSATDSIGPDSQRFYRVVLSP